MSTTEIRSLNGYKLNDETARSNIEKLRTESQQYTDTKISQLINSAPTTLDTLGEIAAAMAENATVVEALDAAIGSKADKNYVDEAIANFPVGEPDWNAKEGEEGYIKNRTHWDNGFDFRFDGDLSKYNDVITISAGSDIMAQILSYVKVSDIPLTKEEILSSTCIKQIKDHQIIETYIEEDLFDRGTFIIFRTGISVFADEVDISELGQKFSKGLYLQHTCIDMTETPEVEHIMYPVRLYKEDVHTLDEKFIPSTIVRTKDVITPVQSDWNTNDESDLSYIKNRTHYEVEKTIELLPITTVVSDAPSAIADFTEDWNNDQFVALGNSKIYTTFDGKTYTYDSGLDYLETGGSSTTIMLGGNPYLFDNYLTDNGLPFFVGLMPIGRRFIAKWPQDDNEHTFSIKYCSGEYDVHQLNPKFIPTASEEQLIQLLMDIDALPAMTDSNGAIFTHKDSILLI